MPFNLFNKKKQPEQEKLIMPPQEETKQESATPSSEETHQEQVIAAQETANGSTIITQESSEETVATQADQKQDVAEIPSKTYLKAMPLRELSDIEKIKTEVNNGNIVILRVTPLATKSIEDVKNAVNELFQFAESMGGDIARLGEERVVMCPKSVRIWREKTPAPVSSEPLPTVV